MSYNRLRSLAAAALTKAGRATGQGNPLRIQLLTHNYGSRLLLACRPGHGEHSLLRGYYVWPLLPVGVG